MRYSLHYLQGRWFLAAILGALAGPLIIGRGFAWRL
ncbi:hypothetical protein CA267_017850 [Alteromonas pelagimontana]|uniref:Uncharacterized protein n=1 Tax=Alteromonas pelagimontana TaxID=1858656 RepID=A0A6M4MIN3_9ALTE|nr:hypothetical protein CA267_017850 [Alteromonas pelagimontana]